MRLGNKISIIGGGIAGLTTALALNKVGLHCEVYERAQALNEVGAGIWMQPNALKVLDWLGLGDKVRQRGVLLDQVDITNANLIPFKKNDTKVIQDEKGNKIVAIHRAELQKMLFDALPEGTVHLNCDFDTYFYEGKQLKVSFGNTVVNTDVLIGADGIHSKVRHQTFQNTALRYSGQTCWRGIANIDLPHEFQHSGIESWGNKVRFGFSRVSSNSVYWFAVVNARQNEQDNPSTVQSKLETIYKDFHPLVLDIIRHTAADKIIRSDISDLKRVDKWHRDKVLLIGDAAHATTPNMGQGAGQGIEDAYYLANFLTGQQPLNSVFEAFESARREKVDYVVNNSWRFGKIAHSGFGQTIMKAIMKLTPEKVMMKQMHKLYSIQESFE